jgi:hypothetical protein
VQLDPIERYALDHRAQLLARWSEVLPQHGSLGDALGVYAPRIFPDVPPVAFLGFTAIAVSRTERTSAQELGYFQVPQPTYERLLPEASRVLGRESALADWQTDVEQQTVVGLLNLRNHYRALEALGWSAPEGSVWRVALAFASFSAGAGGVQRAWSTYRAQLERDSEPDSRFAYLGSLIVEAWEDSRLPLSPANNHPNPAYTWMRTAQKLASGRLCAVELERIERRDFDSAWFPQFDEDISSLIVRASQGLVAEPPPTDT